MLSPLGWSLWRDVGERASREALYRLGGLNATERRTPEDPDQRILRVFYGRVAMQVEFLAMLDDRMPGTTGQDVVSGIFGRVPSDIDFRPTRARYPAVAVRMPAVMATVPRAVRRLAADTDTWWRQATRDVGSADPADARRTLTTAGERFHETLALHTTCLMGVVQPMFQALSAVVDRAGVGDVAALSGSGGAEMAVVTYIWRAAHGEIPVERVIANHGFHGPAEGELSSRVWREDDSGIRRLLADYAARPDADSPWAQDERRRRTAARVRHEVLTALPRHQRAVARPVLSLAARRIPLRGVGKRSFLQALDVARASARRIGVLLAADGGLAERDDAPTTDPSWSSIMFVSAALVVDIGSALSHAAVVARELGLPCVVNTRDGTRLLRSGDLVRVDGGAGTVQVLTRADAGP